MHKKKPLLTVDLTTAEGFQRGAYVLVDAPKNEPEVLLLATGSEVALCLDAHEKLNAEGIAARVVSMPSWEMFEYYCRQNSSYREQVLPSSVTAPFSVELASTFGWERYVGSDGRMLGMNTFGASAPLKELQKKFGFSADAVATAARETLGRRPS